MTIQLKNGVALGLAVFAIAGASASGSDKNSVDSAKRSIKDVEAKEAEATKSPSERIPSADFDQNGIVTHFDLARFMADFNTGDPVADYNRDGTVGIADLLGFLGDWTLDSAPVVIEADGTDLSPADVDGDRLVTNFDLARFMADYFNEDIAADHNGDGVIGILDLLGFIDDWNAASATGVPEIPADQNNDGLVTVFDLTAFMADYGNGSPAADYDGDGELTVQDMLSFLDDYFAASAGS